jgi:Pentapeptide repeats (8 copies)
MFCSEEGACVRFPQRGAPREGEPRRGAPRWGADLSGADLSRADLQTATLLDTNLTGADLTGWRIHGVSAWGLKLERTKQRDLVITRDGEPTVTVDNIEVAQFIYLLLHNEKIRDVIDTIGRKGVLLLGRFTENRMVVLERLRERLRDFGYLPMVFNFDKPETKDFTETVRLLASQSKFVIVDITNPRSAPLELQATVPDYMVPFVSILQHGEQPFSMFVDLQKKYDWVLRPVVGYPSVDRLIEVLEDKIVRPAEAKFNELLAGGPTNFALRTSERSGCFGGQADRGRLQFDLSAFAARGCVQRINSLVLSTSLPVAT